ncbi:MAG: ACT domain-containing protein [Ilumatobacteraceae bacterium]
MTASRRIRVELEDRPGALAQLAGLLAEHGADVMSIDIHELTDGRAVDEVFVRVPDDWDDAPFRTALEVSGRGSVLDVAVTGPAGDRVVVALQWARHLVANGVQHNEFELAGTIVQLCAGAVAWVGAVDEVGGVELAAEALASLTPVVRDLEEWPPQLDLQDGRGGWVLAIPDHPVQPLRIALVGRRRSSPFTATEITRIQTLLEFTAELR